MNYKLNDMQEKAVLRTEGPVLILAGAGSGKTRVLTHRIAYLTGELGVRPWNILAITFTNKAAREMRERVEKMVPSGTEDMWVMTFHAMCLRILKRHADRLGYPKDFTIYDPEDQKAVLRRIYKDQNINDKIFAPKTVLTAISKAKDELTDTKTFEEQAKGNLHQEGIARIYSLYQRTLYENHAMDFDDLISNTVRLFRLNDDILDMYQEKFRYIMVDEYQDTNTAQYKLVHLLADKYRNLCVVGDDDQSIYRFRGANIRNILDFEDDYPDALVVRLEQNYRSTGIILDAANEVIRHNRGRKEKHLWTDRKDGELITVLENYEERGEAFAVGQEIEKLVKEGRSRRDIAILYRTNAQSRALEEQFVKDSIPYRLFGGTPFYQRMEIKDMLCYLRFLVNDRDYISAGRIINVPTRGIGDVTWEKVRELGIEGNKGVCELIDRIDSYPELQRAAGKLRAFAQMVQTWREAALELPIKELVDRIVTDTGYIPYLQKEDNLKFEDRIENLEELKSRADIYCEQNEFPSLAGFLDELSLVASIDDYDENADAVAMLTLHSAKGLEFPVVFITGVEEGTFPAYQSVMDAMSDPDAMEEERRLMYVGITRAMDKLYLSHVHSRRRNGQHEEKSPSRFLKEIPLGLIEERGMKDSGDAYRSGRFGNEGYDGCRNGGSGYGGSSYGGRSGGSGRVSFDDSYPNDFGGFGSDAAGIFAPHENPYTSKPAPVEKPKGPGLTLTSPDNPDYAPGDTVLHPLFGLGTVLEAQWVNSDYMLKINFAGAGEKKLFAKLGKLKKVGGA